MEKLIDLEKINPMKTTNCTYCILFLISYIIIIWTILEFADSWFCWPQTTGHVTSITVITRLIIWKIEPVILNLLININNIAWNQILCNIIACEYSLFIVLCYVSHRFTGLCPRRDCSICIYYYIQTTLFYHPRRIGQDVSSR